MKFMTKMHQHVEISVYQYNFFKAAAIYTFFDEVFWIFDKEETNEDAEEGGPHQKH